MQRFRWTVPVLMLLTLAGVSVAHAQKTIKPQESAWVKLCDKANAVTKDKDGKEERKEVKICLTHHERLDGKSGVGGGASDRRSGQAAFHDHGTARHAD